jgi:aspartate kinase
VEQLQLGEVVRSDIEGLLSELSSLLKGVSFLRELTPRTKDHLVSFGERMSVRMVAAVLNKVGVPAQHFDAWTLGKRAH